MTNEQGLRPDYQWLDNGECSLCLVLTAPAADWTQSRLTTCCQQIAQQIRSKISSLEDVIPARESITLLFKQPEHRSGIIRRVSSLLDRCTLDENPAPSRVHHIHVCYDPRLAPDLVDLCARLKLSIEQLVELHQSVDYRLDMLGFLPGFMYLSGLPESLHIARKSTPAIRVPAGSIAIAGDQTGIYSLSSPGGWWVIGRTADSLVDFEQNPPMTIQPLDAVQFEAISYDDWLALQEQS